MTDHDGVRARSFGGVADLYEQTRPTYPRAAVDWLLEGSRGREAVDVGAGTGKLTRALVAAGAAVIAVDPLPEMLERLRRALPGVTALEGSAEAIPVSSGAADLVTAGQAFHWFDAGPALDEIHRVLRPGGVLGLVWNLRDDGVDWMRRLSEAMGEAGDVVSLSRTVEHEPVVGHPGFTAVERREFRNPQRFTRERLLGYVASTSAVAVMDEARRSATLARVAALCDWEPELRSGDGFTVPYVAGCVRAVRV